jgi:hypothetical protein
MTVLSGGKSPKHYHVMPAKQLVFKSMVAMPALFLAALGAKARMEYDPFEFVSPTPKQNAAILAYRGVVLKSQPVTLDRGAQYHPEAVRKVAKEWIAEAKDGTLGALIPVSYDDSSREGVKGEIIQQCQSLSSILLTSAAIEANHGRYQESVDDSIVSLKLSHILKYSDYVSVLQFSLYERRALKLIMRSAPSLTSKQGSSLLAQLADVKPSPDALSRVAASQRVMFIEYLRRMGVDATKIESVRPFDRHSVALPTRRFGTALLVSARDDTVPASDEIEMTANDSEAEMTHAYNQLVGYMKNR